MHKTSYHHSIIFHNIKEMSYYSESRLQANNSSVLTGLLYSCGGLSVFHGCSPFVVLWCRYSSVLCSAAMSQTQDVTLCLKHLKETLYEINSISTKAWELFEYRRQQTRNVKYKTKRCSQQFMAHFIEKNFIAHILHLRMHLLSSKCQTTHVIGLVSICFILTDQNLYLLRFSVVKAKCFKSQNWTFKGFKINSC